ncbi:carbon-nitrogen hydrolase [Dacryopinax primogenitus]|uniref:Carbon-nitrogen hydrolase n=1 Tax=Dacryopinax primogenitus (strain DJM 731) TaxID=1858805 RepID=M5G5U1_DACPD|nr:carbon-nitrogen hydrolase [Dacryopinax primogenitus]EJU01162.1 carbon-nitrogen hydrolase [Dacryopinax primogenitus]
MPRILKVAAAQVGPVHLTSTKEETLKRLLTLFYAAAAQCAQIVVFPELTHTTFFPRHLFSDGLELDKFFEVDFYLGYGELTPEGKHYNSSFYYSVTLGQIISRYRKVHLPGTFEPFTTPDAVNQLEKRYFLPGDIPFKAFRVPGLIDAALKRGNTIGGPTAGKGDPIIGQLICNDRRWAEPWRVYGLQGMELMLVGYNTTSHSPGLWGSSKPMTLEEEYKEVMFHHTLVMQYNSYSNSCFSVCAARAGADDGKWGMIGGSCIVDPQGHIIAEAKTDDDEVIVTEIDLKYCRQGE